MDNEIKKDYRWWAKKEKNAYENAMQALDFLEENDSYRQEQNLLHMQMYGNLRVSGLGPAAYYKMASPERVTLNVVKACCDSIAAKILKTKPHATFSVEEGNFSLRRKAKLLDRFVDTQFYQTGFYKKSFQVFLDTVVFGTGVWKFYSEGTKIHVDRVFCGELFVDPVEAMYGEPRTLYQKKYVDRSVLMAMFPDHKSEIALASGPKSEDDVLSGQADSLADQVRVCEAWRLPSPSCDDDEATEEETTDGKHIICLDNVTLVYEDWDDECFPFVFMRWSDRLRGFWGMGLVEELMGIQVEINRLLIKIQKSFHLMAVPRVFMEIGSKVNKVHLNNDIGAIVPYQGTPPIVSVAPTVHPEIFNHLNWLWLRAFDYAGLTQAMPENIPKGLETGAAVRQYRNIESERFSVAHNQWDEACRECALRVVHLAKEISEDHPDWTVVAARDRYTISKVPFKDIDMDADSFVMKVFPTSSLPHEPAGKMAMVEQLNQIAPMPPERLLRMLDFPDLDDELSLERATTDGIDRMVEKMLDDNEYLPPEPFMDPQLTLSRVQAAYLRAQNEGCPDDRLQLLREFMRAMTEIAAAAQAAMAPMAPPGQEQPSEGGMPSETSPEGGAPMGPDAMAGPPKGM